MPLRRTWLQRSTISPACNVGFASIGKVGVSATHRRVKVLGSSYCRARAGPHHARARIACICSTARIRSFAKAGSMKQRTMFVLLIALNGARVALAQTDEERQSCVNDALQLCQEAIPDRERVFGCLVSHMNLLSPACHAVMAHTQATDQPPSKKPALRAKSAKGEGTSAKHASKAVSETPVKRGSKVGSGRSAKQASKAVSRPNRRPLNLLPHSRGHPHVAGFDPSWASVAFGT